MIHFKLGELFSGPGGLAWGAVNASLNGFKICHEWAVDYDESACQTFARNISPNNPQSVLCCDVRKLDIESLSEIDAFAYGFPCNDFSIVGEQKGFDGEFGPLYVYGVKVLEYFKPKFFVAENVGGLIKANQGKAFKRIISDLKNAGNGYNLTTHLYKSEEYGVPQTRHRIIIVGISKDLGVNFQVPSPTTKSRPITVKESLNNLDFTLANNEITAQSAVVVERLKYIKPGENAWTADLPEELRLNVKGARMSQIYKRLDPNKPAYTITGSGGGGTHVYHWSENRALTNRERARLQTFPDSFIFEGSKEAVRKQIGMAVPPVLAKIIFTAILKTLAGIEYQSIPANCEEEAELSCS